VLVDDVIAPSFQVAVVRILRIEEHGDGQQVIVGQGFTSMESSYTDGTIDFARFHSYIVGDLSPDVKMWTPDQVIGKGLCFFLNKNEPYRKPHKEQRWSFSLLHHCLK
jgi:hypothetical protein